MVRVCNNPALLDGIDTATLYEANANALITKGDFQKAIDNFINAKSDFLIVAACFPDFVPQSLQTLHNITQVCFFSLCILLLIFILVDIQFSLKS